MCERPTTQHLVSLCSSQASVYRDSLRQASYNELSMDSSLNKTLPTAVLFFHVFPLHVVSMICRDSLNLTISISRNLDAR